MDYLISEEQFIPLMKMFLEDVVTPMLLNLYSEENLRDGYFPFVVTGIVLGERLDRNERTGTLYPHFNVFYDGYVNEYSRESIGKTVKKQIEKYFQELVISPNSSFKFVKKSK
jgi:hypothetical protein